MRPATLDLDGLLRALPPAHPPRRDGRGAERDPVRHITLGHVDQAEDAIRVAESLWRAEASSRPERRAAHDAYRRFLLLALLSSGGPKARR